MADPIDEMMDVIDAYVACKDRGVRERDALRAAVDAALDRAKDEGQEEGEQYGDTALIEMRKKKEVAETAQIAAEKFAERLMESLGWDRIDRDRFERLGVLPCRT